MFRSYVTNDNVVELCLTLGLCSEGITQLNSLMTPRKGVKKGESLFNQGERLESLYAIRSGFFKTTMTTKEGKEQVSGFQMMGEMLGMDAISTEHHTSSAIALVDSVVYGVDFSQLQQLGREFPALQRNFMKLMSDEIVHSRTVLLMMGTMNSDERLAAFLLNLSGRFALRGYSPISFILRMRREDIASYLGLRMETICRAVTRLREMSLANLSGRDVEIVNLPGLKDHVAGFSRQRV
ncbi:cyclic nucleotide-binding domain-containing protein [Pseudomonas sp. SIMBA_041]|uniref:cyclic nucleotide-binding domain-containing protein n=1 Tax=Pseudomonas sp. SIMBA_041 TaxID=3085782 RepID=UPI00397E27B8